MQGTQPTSIYDVKHFLMDCPLYARERYKHCKTRNTGLKNLLYEKTQSRTIVKPVAVSYRRRKISDM